MTPEKINLQTVRDSLDPNVKAHYSVKWFGRPIGNLWTPLFYNTGWSADGVTQFRMVIAAIAVACLLLPDYGWAVVGALTFYVCFILDCVDGNIARLRVTVTYWGKFIDGLADFIFVQGAPFAVGAGIWLYEGSGTWLMLGALITSVTLAHQMVRSRLSFFREWMTSLTGPLTDDDLSRTAVARRWQGHAANIYVNGTFLSPILLVLPESGRKAYLLAVAVTLMGAELMWMCATLMEAKALLRRNRRSIHSPPPTPEDPS